MHEVHLITFYFNHCFGYEFDDGWIFQQSTLIFMISSTVFLFMLREQNKTNIQSICTAFLIPNI
jgi:hypothetical protein